VPKSALPCVTRLCIRRAIRRILRYSESTNFKNLPCHSQPECSAEKTEDFMSLPRLASVIAITILLQATVMHASEPTASCTFDTFSAPSGYTLAQVNGVSDEGTVVGQLMDNKTQAFVAFTYSSSGVFTEYTVPKSSSTWMYGQNGSGLNAGSYQDTK